MEKGMTVLDIGSGMGYFSLPAASMIGRKGKVICIDLQEKMIASLNKRAEKASLSEIIETRICGTGSLTIDDLDGKIDFAMAFALVHEVPDKDRLFQEINKSLKYGGKLLLAEPKGHVLNDEFSHAISTAQHENFDVLNYPAITRTHAVILQKKLC